MNTARSKLVQFLRWSERYTKTDMVYLSKGGFWLLLGYGIPVAGGLITSVAFANLLPHTAYGTYQFVMAMSAILGAFTLSGMSTALMRSVAQGAQGALPYAFKKQLQWGLGIVAASGGVALYYFLNGNNTLGSAFLIVGACAPLLSASNLYRPFLEGKQLFKESTMLGLWRRPIPIFAIIVALLLTDDPLILVLTYFASQTLSSTLLYFMVRRKFAEQEQKHPKLLTYGKHMSVLSTISLVVNNIDSVIIFHYLGAAPVAIYTFAHLPLLHLGKMFSQVSTLVFPKFAQQNFGVLRSSILGKVFVYSIPTTVVVTAYYFAAPYIFALLFPAYHEAVLLSQVLVLTLLLKPFTMYIQAFAALGFKRSQYFIHISTAAVKLVLLFTLLPIFGLWGAVWAIIASTIYWSIVTITLFYAHKYQG